MNLLKDFKQRFLSWGADIRIYWLGLILFGNSHYEIKGPHTREILNVLKPGDILLRRYNHYLGSIFIPGYWSHAAHYVGDGDVIHMLGDGITREDILTFTRCDDILILRCTDVELVKYSITESINLEDKNIQYDYDFKSGNKTLYCSEHVNQVFKNPVNKSMVLPDDLLTVDVFQVVWSKKKV
jgi:cell wall-associated NlpC family hydrolase